MSRPRWMVCEMSGRWATALRIALARSGWPQTSVPRLLEVRQLAELTEKLDQRPHDMALVEVRRENAMEVLLWLAKARREYWQARFIAVVDRGIWQSTDASTATWRRARQPLIDALLEAGAVDVVTSPRHLDAVLAIGQRHAALDTERLHGQAARMSVADWISASLPWQDE